MDDVAKLLDFGLVKSVARKGDQTNITQTGTVTGTPKYMSPEQAFGEEEPDVGSDLYSLGAVGYSMLSGKAPFEGSTAMHIMIAHARDRVVPLRRLNEDVPESLEAVITRCLEKRPKDRFLDARSLREALVSCDLGEPWTQADAEKWWLDVAAESANLETVDRPIPSESVLD